MTVSATEMLERYATAVKRDIEGTAVSLVAAFDHVPNTYVFVKDVERVFVACNEPFVELMGCATKEEIYGRRDEDFSPDYLVEGHLEEAS